MSRLQSYVNDDGKIGESVEVRDGGHQDGGSGGDGDELAISDGGEDREEGVGVVTDGLDLERRG